ncbi:DUF1190 domain-containing protein [Novispirillum itersonii]|uniref:DUF1190 domain-containing protein n=1 Tax=Novispirillum itersonii TaxID=189 RepID=UPI00036EEB91|nr:DUF1190 domain-containing protein [Novispirillum itersonii]
MKRSRALALTLMATGSFTLAACNDDPPDGGSADAGGDGYTTYQACVDGGKYTPSYCETALGLVPDLKPQDKIYATVQECVAVPGNTVEQCTQAFNAAKESLPKFLSQTDCESALGAAACQSVTQNGTSFWTPLLTGYVLSQVIDGLTDRRYGRPVYRAPDKSWRPYPASPPPTAGKRYDSQPWAGSGSSRQSSTAPAPKAERTSVISRSGFGGGGGSWGG